MPSFNNAVNAQQQGVQYLSSVGAWVGLDGSTAGKVLTSNGTGVAPSFQSISVPVQNLVTTFNASGTFSKNSLTVAITVIVIDGGGGGGSGMRGATGAAGGGGGGGGSVALIAHRIPASAFLASETVTIGAGGTGGLAVTVDNTIGNVGIIGGKTSIGGIYGTQGPIGTGGINGSSGSSTNAASTGAYLWGTTNAGQVTGNPGATGNVDVGSNANTSTAAVTGTLQALAPVPTGGGGGGGANNAVIKRGGTGGLLRDSGTITVIAGGISGQEGGVSINGGNGNPGLIQGGYFYGGSGGGGGGGQSAGAVAGIGGTGGFPGAGGGGGGGSLNGTNSGAGGAGGAGQVIVIEWFC